MAFPNLKKKDGAANTRALELSVEDLENARMMRAKISNKLIESFIRQNNIVALKTLFYIAQFDIQIVQNQRMQTLKIDLDDLCMTTNTHRETLRKNIRRMQRTILTFETEDGVEDIVVIPRAEYCYGKKTLEIDMYTKVLQLVAQVKRQFTTIDTRYIMALENKHSVRMLALLERIKNYQSNVAKRKHLTLEELNLFFGTHYKRIAEFERKILKPVQEELNQKAKLSFIYEVEYQSVGRGRPKAVGVVIDLVENKPQPSLF